MQKVLSPAAAVLILLAMTQVSAAQLNPASPPIADPRDGRFAAVTEQWTTPSLAGSQLVAVAPQSAGVVERSGWTSELLRLQWRFGDPIEVYVIRPKGAKKPPVVLYLDGIDAEIDKFKSEQFQEGATRDGCAAVAFVPALTGPRFHDRPMSEWFVSDLQEGLAVSAHDVQMVLNYLETRGDLDMDRVGILAQDAGASVAILAAAVDARIRVLDLVDVWGDWPDWLSGSPVVPEAERVMYLKPEFLARVENLDPMDWLPKVSARVRLQDAVFAPSSPAKAKEKMRAAVPAGATVVVYRTPGQTAAISNGTAALQWIETQLREPETANAKAAGIPAQHATR